LAAKTEDLAEKEMCLEALLALDPDFEWAQIALRNTRYWQVQAN
jgi:hypothetical protein